MLRFVTMAFALVILFCSAGVSRADNVYEVSLPSLNGVYKAGASSPGAQANWSIPTQDGTVPLESIALHYDLTIVSPTAVTSASLESGGSILFSDPTSPGNNLGAEWGIPLAPGQFSFDSQANEFRFIVTALSKNSFDIWVIDNLQQAYGSTPNSDGTGTVSLTFGSSNGQPLAAVVTSVDALFSPDSVISPSSETILVTPEPPSIVLVGGLALVLGSLKLRRLILLRASPQ